MRGFMAVVLAAMLAGCGNTQTSGIVAIGPDTYAVETRGRALATAVERGLTEATSFCTAQSRQTELLGTRINSESYQVAFRCTGGGGGALGGGPGLIGRVPAGYAQRNSPLGPIPVSAPISGARGTVITGQAFPPARPPEPGLDLGTVGSLPGRTATVAGNPFAQPEPVPRPSPRSLPPLSSLPAQAAFQAPLPAASAAASTPLAPSPFAPLVSPLAAQGAAAAAAPVVLTPPPVFAAPAPAPAFAPLQSPLVPAAAAAPAAEPPFQPLTSPAAAPAFAPAASPAFAPLPAAQGLGSLPAASSALPAVASPGRSLNRDVPPALPGPATVPAAAPGAPLGQPGVVPPAGFWNTAPR